MTAIPPIVRECNEFVGGAAQHRVAPKDSRRQAISVACGHPRRSSSRDTSEHRTGTVCFIGRKFSSRFRSERSRIFRGQHSIRPLPAGCRMQAAVYGLHSCCTESPAEDGRDFDRSGQCGNGHQVGRVLKDRLQRGLIRSCNGMITAGPMLRIHVRQRKHSERGQSFQSMSAPLQPG